LVWPNGPDYSENSLAVWRKDETELVRLNITSHNRSTDNTITLLFGHATYMATVLADSVITWCGKIEAIIIISLAHTKQTHIFAIIINFAQWMVTNQCDIGSYYVTISNPVAQILVFSLYLALVWMNNYNNKIFKAKLA
jgi:hypothetical protein